MRASVVVPVYNEEACLGSCLASLVSQDMPLEIVVVDDGSSDRSAAIAESFPVRVVKTPHLGAGSARNKGAKLATGQILVFVDADMVFEKNFVRKLIEPIVKGKTIGTFTKNEIVKNWYNSWARSWNYNENLAGPFRVPASYDNESPVFRAILKEVFDKSGGFDTQSGYTDDWSLSRKLGVKASIAKDAICYHYNPASLTDVWFQARWIGHNEFLARNIFKLIQYGFPFSLVIGFWKSVRYQELGFLLFKIVYDFAVWFSILESFFRKRVAR